jgi:ubiquinone/menaquinone biosynthesis C-methylase UbiE
MNPPTWQFDEFQQIGVNFADEAEVRAYDERHGNTDDDERRLIQSLGIKSGDIVIDIGAGTGCFATQAALAGARVCAVDVSRLMLDYTRSRAQRAGVNETLQYHHAGFLTYRHEGPPADWVVTKFALHHLPEFWKGVALERMAAMLKPGGRLYIEDVVFGFGSDQHAEQIERWISSVAAEAGGSGFPRAVFEMHVRQEYSTYAWILEGLIDRAGLRIDRREIERIVYARYLCTRL